jgi:hypothetical protein
MLRNVGPADRAVRIVIGAVIAFLVAMGLVTGWFAAALGIFGAVMLLTGLTGSCPAYRAMDIDSLNHADAYKQVDEAI